MTGRATPAPPHEGVGDGVVGRKAATGARGGRRLRQDAPDGIVAQLLAETRPADGDDLAEVQRRVLAPQVDDRLPQFVGHALMALPRRRRL